jgi:phosphoadenosine phosphosulfate reductase
MKVSAVASDAEGESNEPVEVLSSQEQGGEVQDEVEAPVSGFTEEYLATMNQVLSQQTLGAVLEWCCNSLPNLFQVTSFGSAGMVILHELHKLNLNVTSIFLDTLYHFEETLEHARTVEKQYNLIVHWYRCPRAATRTEFETVFNSNDMWISHPRRYEWLTKVEPLERALKELKVSAWITGRRRDQGGLRTDLPILELDIDGRLKVNPLAHWTREEVWAYLRREGVPYNPLFDKSYGSIGDTVTTSQTADPSAGERSGRFHQFEGKKTECGIHIRRAPSHDAQLSKDVSASSKGITN